MPLFLGNLALGLSRRYDRMKAPEDLEEATDLFRRAIDLSPVDSPGLPMFLSNLAACLARRSGGGKEPGPLDEPIRLLRQALAGAPQGAPIRPRCLHNLASCLRQRAETDAAGQDVAEARATYRLAVIEGLEECPERALGSAREWGDWASQRASWGEAAEAYGYARQAMERLLGSQLLRPARGTWLREGQALAAREAFACMQAGDLAGAVLALEQGSARLLADALDRDASRLATLRARHPDLADRYEQLSAQLLGLEAEADFVESRPPDMARFARRRQARKDLETVLSEIHQLTGYETFLSAPSWEEIQVALHLATEEEATALVYLATSPAGSVVLMVREEGIESFDADFAAEALVRLLEETRDGQPVGGYLPGIVLPGETAHEWLKSSLARLLPVLGRQIAAPLAERLCGRVTRIVLIPVGPLALLPLHAAGGGLLLESFTVSYTPNARSLAAALRAHQGRREEAPTFTGVGNPLPHPIPLRSAEAEAEAIASLFPSERRHVVTGSAATREAVLGMLTEGTHLHFACHGTFDPEKPLGSGLELAGGEMLTLADLLGGPARPVQARLAVLSACRSAVRDFHDLPDELIGLPAGFLEAGVPGVIGTLWPVDDLPTALLMVRFYSFCLAEAIPPAEALRRAQLWLRDLTAGRLAQYFADPAAAMDRFGKVQPRWPPGFIVSARSWFALLAPDARPFADPYWWGGFLFLGA